MQCQHQETDRMMLTGVEKKSTPLLGRKLLNISCLNLLISMDALLMKPAACLVLLRWLKHLVGSLFCEVLNKIMTVSVLSGNKWLLQALGRLGTSSCFAEEGIGVPPAEDRRAGSGPVNIDYLIIQDNSNPWLFKHGTAPSWWAFHHPNELLEELK